MFPTDQQKRLQVVNSSNPSLRSVAAPFSLQGGNFSLQGAANTAAPQLASNLRLGPVQVAHPGGLQVGNQVIQQNGGNTNSQPRLPTVNPFIAGLKSIGQSAISPYTYSFDVGAALGSNINSRFTNNQLERQQSNEDIHNLLTPSKIAGNVAQIGLLAAGGPIGKAGEAVGAPIAGRLFGGFAPKLVGTGTKLIGGSLVGAPVGGAYNVAASVGNGELTKKNALKTFGTGAALGAALGGPLDAGLSAAGSGLKRMFNPSEHTQITRVLAKEKDPNAVHDFLKSVYGGTSDAIKQASVDIAHATNNKVVSAILDHIPEEAGAGAVGGSLAKGATEKTAEQVVRQKQAAAHQKEAPRTEEINFGSVDSRTLPPAEKGTAEFTSEEQQVLDDAGIDTTPAYQRGTPRTVGEAAAQAKAGVYNAKDEVFNADKRVNEVAEPGSTPKVDVPSYIKRDPNAAIADANSNLQRIDTLISQIGNHTSAQFNARQELANELRAHPGNRQAILAKYERSKTVYNPDDVQKTTSELLAERQKYQNVLNLAKEAQTPDTAPPIPEAPAVAKEAVAAQATPETPAVGAPEGVANSVENQPGGLAEAINKGADQSIKKLPTEIPKHTNALQRTFLSVSGELSKMGEAGQAIADKLKAARDTSETGQAWFIKQIPSVLKLKGKDFTEFVDTLDRLGKGGSLDGVEPKIAQAVQEWSAAIPEVRNVAQEAGVEVGDLGPHYFPRNYTELLKNQDGMNKVANQLVKSGQAANIGEALQQLRFMKRQYSTKFGHFENARKFDLPGYDKSRNALISYVEGAFNKIGHAEQFGPKGEQASQLVAELGSQGHDVERASRLLKIANGTEEYNQPGVETASNAVRAFNRTTKLGLSAILNAGQTVNTASAGGFARTIKNAGKFLSKNDKDFVDATGVNADSVLSNLREQTGVAGKITGKITAPGFNAIERFNRGTASLVGRDTANMLAEKAANGNAAAAESLSKGFGIDEVPADGILNPEQQIKAARNFVERAQFKVDPQDLPAWANSPMGKMAAQFRTFSYKQQKFIQDEVLKQAANGNVLPLVRFVAVGAPVGLATSTVRGFLRGQPATQVKGNQDNPTKSALGKFVDALNNAGGFGMGSSALFPVQNVKSARFPQYLASSVLGPTAGLAVQTATNVQQAAAGSPKAAERQGLAAIPVAGPFIANKTIPYKPPKAKSTQPRDPVTGKVLGKNAQDAMSNDPAVRWDNLTSKAKANVALNQPDNYLARETDRINRQLQSGKLDEAQAFAQYNKAQKTSKVSAIQKNYTKNIRDAYSLNTTDFKSYLQSHTKDIASLFDLDQHLLAAGLIAKSKFPKAKATTSSGSGSSRSRGFSSRSNSGGGSSGNTQITVVGTDGQPRKVTIDANGHQVGSTGLSSLLPSNLSFKTASIDTTPKKLSFKVNLPTDVRGNPRPQRVASTRYATVRIK